MTMPPLDTPHFLAITAAVNTSPEPFSNVGMSLLGDAGDPLAQYLRAVQLIDGDTRR